MKAEYYYNELMDENHNNEGYDGWYCNGMVTIHKIGSNDKDVTYTLYRSGNIIDSNGKRDYIISDLIGDYEPYSPVQILKCGYLLFNTTSFNQVKHIISNLHEYFDSEEYDYNLLEKDRHFICGGNSWENGLTEGFSYYAPNGIEVSICSIPKLCYKNSRRSKYGKRCLPFNKSYSKVNYVYVYFTTNILGHLIDSDLNCLVNEALTDLIDNLPDCKYINMKMFKYIYS